MVIVLGMLHPTGGELHLSPRRPSRNQIPPSVIQPASQQQPNHHRHSAGCGKGQRRRDLQLRQLRGPRRGAMSAAPRHDDRGARNQRAAVSRAVLLTANAQRLRARVRPPTQGERSRNPTPGHRLARPHPRVLPHRALVRAGHGLRGQLAAVPEPDAGAGLRRPAVLV